jgi:hypothetical protein
LEIGFGGRGVERNHDLRESDVDESVGHLLIQKRAVRGDKDIQDAVRFRQGHGAREVVTQKRLIIVIQLHRAESMFGAFGDSPTEELERHELAFYFQMRLGAKGTSEVTAGIQSKIELKGELGDAGERLGLMIPLAEFPPPSLILLVRHVGRAEVKLFVIEDRGQFTLHEII